MSGKQGPEGAPLVIVEQGAEVPAWVPADEQEEFGEALDQGACVCVRQPFSFWQLSTSDEEDLARWLLRVAQREDGAQS